MSNNHSGLQAEYLATECGRRKHPLLCKRQERWRTGKSDAWEFYRYCVCGHYRAGVRVEKHEIVGDVEDVKAMEKAAHDRWLKERGYAT